MQSSTHSRSSHCQGKNVNCNILTGFCNFVSLLEGVRDGIQKLGSFFSFPAAMFDTEAALLASLVLEPEKWGTVTLYLFPYS